ncbi:peroxide stress protein YaaA [Streptomyces sp. AJS327]|uniref:peroxide stress protein YaaA n=1 Tax=Streptomyces sp. AJS327 TaxID=2545265 RepID=UPI0015DD6361|nr:peroxide stress protein YaaA [Streptomyces sp. AJS327]MBA0050047.1 peroxide stress protein YaaA [Streptomyces sp. AJS327]
MLVLLPPSEGKAEGKRGRPLDLGSLSLPGLAGARERVLDELVELCSGDAGKARRVLGLSEGQRDEVAKNAALRTAPALPAAELYTGVLYDALGLGSLSTAAKRRATGSLLVFSGLWGAVGVRDRLPSYRCSGTVRLPGAGALGAYWRAPLEAELPVAAGGGPLLDLRSTPYAAMWKPTGELAERTVTIRVLHSTTVNGVEKRSVVSHFNKATKGRIVRGLLEAGGTPRTPAALVDAVRALGYRVEGEPPSRAGKPWPLDVVVTAL